MISNKSLEYRVNKWLDKPIMSNNGHLLTKIDDECVNYFYRDYCYDYFLKLKKIIINSGNTILNEEEFKDRVIYLLYKYCEDELY